LASGWEYRLPTEAQWEYAARAGSPSGYCFGDDKSQLENYAWFFDNAWGIGEEYAHQVGQKRPNQGGLFDLHGNCWEWTADVYADYPPGTVTDPLVKDGGSDCVSRGGSFDDSSKGCRTGFWTWSSPDDRLLNLGFRLVLRSTELVEPSLPLPLGRIFRVGCLVAFQSEPLQRVFRNFGYAD